jgi:Domain of unknown function (DUF1926)/Glycosyl hydrolase family 57/Domain of unknown function (DUF1925)
VPKFELVLLIHAHQPVGNFDSVLEDAYAYCYLPFVQVLEKHPSIRLGLHYTGPLLEWMDRTHPEYFDLVRALVQRGQVEVAGGGFYEPILVTIPTQDRYDQLTKLADFVEKHFGKRPRGAWLAERVWEPQLPSSLAVAGVEYTLVDDNHFLGAGFELEELYGHYLCEDMGQSVKMLPSLKMLRYLTPFRPVHETIDFLRGAAQKHAGEFAAMGDDLEKFGVWPGTNELCYGEGWLEEFFSALEKNSDWIATSTPGDAVTSHAALGCANLPTASYTEMMEWALPTPARNRYHALVEEFANRPEALPFLRGGIWRGFFTKYAESNLMHKKMLHVSQKVQRLAKSTRTDKAFLRACEEAKTQLLRGQCNDPYWHGVFGGLYSPHLRTAVWCALERAETIADALEHEGVGGPQAGGGGTRGTAGFAGGAQSATQARVAQGGGLSARQAATQSGTTAAVQSGGAGGGPSGVSGGAGASQTAYTHAKQFDFDADGYDEFYFTSDRYAALVAPQDGGTLSALDFRPANITLVNSLRRREESYHAKLKEASTAPVQGAPTIHEQTRAKEAGLERYLHYDRWERNCFRLLVFGQNKTYEDCATVQLEEDAALAGGAYEVMGFSDKRITLVSPEGDWRAEKSLTFQATEEGFDAVCELTVSYKPGAIAGAIAGAKEKATVNIGLEAVVNFLAPAAADRYFESRGKRFPLRWAAALAGEELRVVDEYQRAAVKFEAPASRNFWISAIDTVSESEDGFERIYQGSEVIAIWPVTLGAGEEWKGKFVLKAQRLT